MATPTNKEHFSGGLAKALAEKWQVDDVRLKAASDFERLASRSELKKKMLETITLLEMKQEELEAFVEFLYSDGSMLSANMKQHVRSLYLAADKYEILHLRDLCRDELISSLSLSNSLDILELAQIPFDKDLNDAAFCYIKKNISTIASSDEFELFIVSNPNLAVEIIKASLTLMSSSLTIRCPQCGSNISQNETRINCSSCGCNYCLIWI